MNRHLLTGLIVGAVIASLVTWLLLDGGTPDSATEVEREPLYWVAPMDPDYRRDQPGKSPMGMDLVPVYADAAAADDPGVVRISPDVENNLGVRTVVVARELWETDIRTVGYVTFDQDRLLHIHPRVAGWVETLHVKASGDPVSPGQALYELSAP